MNWSWLWPIVTGRSIFDGWTVVHAAFWIFAGSTLASFHMSLLNCLLVTYVVATGWEVFERYAEKHWPQIWKHPESWWNSYLSDIGFCGTLGTTLGYLIAVNQ